MSNEYQFEETEILVQPGSDALGPFSFDLKPQIEDTDSITGVTVRSYLCGQETTALLIDGVPTLTAGVVYVRFQWPGADYKGNHKLTFTYTTNSGYTDEADFCCVKVKDV